MTMLLKISLKDFFPIDWGHYSVGILFSEISIEQYKKILSNSRIFPFRGTSHLKKINPVLFGSIIWYLEESDDPRYTGADRILININHYSIPQLIVLGERNHEFII